MAEKTKNKLIVTLPSDTAIKMEREFDAPQKLTYEVFTQKEHIEKWWAPPFTKLISVEMDNRVGGKYRYVFQGSSAGGPGGPEMYFTGENLELVPYSKIVYTEIFVTPEFTSPAGTITTTFTDIGGGRTRIVSLCEYHTKETRDAVVTSGMETGAAISYDQAEALALKLLTKDR